MKSRDVFDVAIRIVGLAFLYNASSTLLNVLANICGSFPHFYFRMLWPILWPGLLIAGCQLGLAYWLVRGAPWLMSLAYKPEARNAFQSTGSAPSSSTPLGRI